MKEAFEKIKERLTGAESVKLYGSKNSGNYLLPLEDAFSIVSEVEAEYINKSTEHINKSSDCSTGWIPCSERLPKEPGKYLVTVKNLTGFWILENNVFVCDYAYDTFIFQGWEDNEVIAWMPLPEPYNPEKGAQDGGDNEGNNKD